MARPSTGASAGNHCTAQERREEPEEIGLGPRRRSALYAFY